MFSLVKLLVFTSECLLLKAIRCVTNLYKVYSQNSVLAERSLEDQLILLCPLGLLQAQPGLLASVSGLRALAL